MKKSIIWSIVLLITVTVACKQNEDNASALQNSATAPTAHTKETKAAQVTFVEIGSVNCIPCRMMQPVMKKVEEKYGKKVSIVFYDVWTQEGAPYAEKFKIRVIPTQVFLDSNGKEFFRHEGYFPFEAIDALLQQHGIKP